MRVLLIGDYSSVHLNIFNELRRRGDFEVELASSGDGFKGTGRSISIGNDGSGFFSKISKAVIPLSRIQSFKGFDIVQFMNPFVFTMNFSVNEILIKSIFKNNDKVFLLAAGCDSVFEKNIKSVYPNEFHPCPGCLKYEQKAETCKFSRQNFHKINDYFIKNVKKVIPVSESYHDVYKQYGINNLAPLLRMPIDFTNILQRESYEVNGKIKIMHGINRIGFKGSDIILEALKKFSNNDRVEFKIVEKLPLKEYLSLLRDVDVVIDQVYGYGIGMNSLYSMANGAISFTNFINQFYPDSPAIRITPSISSICSSIENLLSEDKKLIAERKKLSYEYVLKNNDVKDIVNKLIHIWQNS